MTCFTGCSHSRQLSFDKTYRDARLKLEAGDLTSALTSAEQGLRESEEGKDPVWNCKFRILKAEILDLQGVPRDALALLGMELPPALSSGEFAVRRKLTQGRALTSLGQFSAAQIPFLEATKLAVTSAPALLGEVTLGEGQLLLLRNDAASAKQSFQRALQLAREYRQPLLEAKALGSLGWLSARMEHYDEAIDWLTASLDVARSHHARHLEAITLLNLGWSYLELGDFDNAIPLFTVAEKISSDMGVKIIRQKSLNELGNIYLAEGNYQAALDYYSRALAIARDMNSTPTVAVSLNNLGFVALKTGRLEDAGRYTQEARTIRPQDKDHQSELRSSLIAADIAKAGANFSRAESLLLQIIRDKDVRKSLRWEGEAALANIYVAQGKSLRAEDQFQESLVTLDSVRAELRQDKYKLAFSSITTEFYSSYIRFLVAQKNPAKALQIAEFSRARTLAEGLGMAGPNKLTEIHIPAAQQFLKQHNQVVLAYWLAPQGSFLWAITPSQVRLFSLPPRQEIDLKVENYKEILLGPKDVRDTDRSGEELYRLLVQPAEKLIPPGAQVVVIPDGSLNKLNFETLRVPGDPSRYWIDDVEVENASSIALLTRARLRKPGDGHRLLLIGNPLQASSDYPVLTHAADELERVAAHFPANEKAVISGKDATPSAYTLSRPGEFDLIHFVTHGTASEITPLESAIVLSPEGQQPYKLYARDIVNTPLRADAVIISACYGAGKRTYSGEGLVGLAWAFMRAGAHQVVAGLWQVDDGSTPELMDHFYTELHKGKGAGDALRTAKLALLHSETQYSQPYYWASLQLYTGS